MELKGALVCLRGEGETNTQAGLPTSTTVVINSWGGGGGGGLSSTKTVQCLTALKLFILNNTLACALCQISTTMTSWFTTQVPASFITANAL